MNRKKIIFYIVLIVCCLLLGRRIGNTAENVTEIGVSTLQGSVNGTCFNDVNQDGKINQGEQGIPGVTVALRRFYFIGCSFKEVASTETDADGKYVFSVNRAGIYQIEESDPPGSTSTTPNKVVFFIGPVKTGQVISFGDILDNANKPTVSITADPPVIQNGGSSMLNWSSENADTVTIDQGIGSVQAAGTLEVFPQETTTYTITAVGTGGTAQSSVTVTIQNNLTTTTINSSTTTIPNPPPPTTTTTSHGGGGSTSTPLTSTTSVEPETTTTTEILITTTTVPGTQIELKGFKAMPGNTKVTLTWETETEIDNAGFNLSRAESETGPYTKINASLIAATGFSTQGASYEFVDTNLQNRKTYYYKLEDIDLNGTSTIHGPVEATPRFMLGMINNK